MSKQRPEARTFMDGETQTQAHEFFDADIDKMGDVHIQESSFEFDTGHLRDTVMGAVVEACRLAHRVACQPSLGLCPGGFPGF
ncbi:MAG: hypothetical protein GEU77_14740 [Deltaproteobacteria bacterium]|nr:hypothetical protein [Deltaproteobacteria bacterium]